MTECHEIAAALAPDAPLFDNTDAARAWVRARMPGESLQVIDNITQALPPAPLPCHQWSEPVSDNELRSVLLAVLLSRGWIVRPGPALAQKEYVTAVGPKTATAWFSADAFNASVTGNYESEGRNILAPLGVLIPLEASVTSLQAGAALFCDRADAAVAESYAGRLLMQVAA